MWRSKRVQQQSGEKKCYDIVSFKVEQNQWGERSPTRADSVSGLRQIERKAGDEKQRKEEVFAIVSVANGGRPLAFDLCLLQC